MCRIAGIINPSMETERLQSLAKGMCNLLKHGGPDDEGVFVNEAAHLVFGHRRLSIIDISSAGQQPMHYLNNRYTITYNGELYNFLELKLELKQKGFSFTTNSDTEVILAAYAAWGCNAFSKFNGMFAFAIWDNELKEIVIARGSAGIKPLYYALTKEGFAFASEIRAFQQLDYLQNSNKNWPVYLMAYGHLPEPITTLNNVQPLEKGTYLKYNTLSKSASSNTFTRINYIEKVDNRKQAIELIKIELDAAVKRHLIADAPIGVFLSGGLDSSIIALLAHRHQEQLNTLSIYFEDPTYSEKKYQDLVLQKINCNHQQFLLKENDFHTHLPDIISQMDLPCCDGINTWFISKFARQSGLKAVLSGIGGDELFGGYPSFNRIKTALALQKIPNSILRAGKFTDSKKFKRLSYLSIPGAVGRYLFLRGQFIPKDIAAILNTDEAEIWKVLEEPLQLPDINYLSAFNQASWLETNMYMQNQLLRDADVMSMAHGLEIRVPFLDKEFLKLAMKIKSDIKFNGKLGKQLLIDAFIDILPEPIWNRPKMGFSFPFKDWLSNGQYRTTASGKDLSNAHEKLLANEMHWSQFFTLILLENYRDGK